VSEGEQHQAIKYSGTYLIALLWSVTTLGDDTDDVSNDVMMLNRIIRRLTSFLLSFMKKIKQWVVLILLQLKWRFGTTQKLLLLHSPDFINFYSGRRVVVAAVLVWSQLLKWSARIELKSLDYPSCRLWLTCLYITLSLLQASHIKDITVSSLGSSTESWAKSGVYDCLILSAV